MSFSGQRMRRASSMLGRQAADAEEEEPPSKPALQQQPSWAQLARAHAGQYAAVAGTLVALALSEGWKPYAHVLYTGPTADLETWKYSYPLRPNHVPAWAVPAVALLSPIAVVAAWLLAGRIGRAEAHHSILLAVACVASTGLLTNWIKVNVGRPRPHFVHRCWPNGGTPTFTPGGLPKCADDAVNVAEGSKSFPSGHTSWSTSGLGFLTFWLLGKLTVFDGQAQPTRFLAAVAPLLGAVWIGMSRVQDYWHHVEDVAAGFCIGLLMAFCFYRQIYAGLTSRHAGQLTAAVRSRGGLAASPSRPSLLHGGGEAASDGSNPGDERV